MKRVAIKQDSHCECGLPFVQFGLITFIVFALFANSAQGGELYSWTDEKGVRHYSDGPPHRSAKDVTVTSLKQPEDTRSIDSQNREYGESRAEMPEEYEQRMQQQAEEVSRVWEEYLDAFGRGDLDGAASFHTPGSRERYRQIYKDLGLK